MPKDRRVESATANWGPRFVANGIPFTDFLDVTATVDRWDQWCQAWSQRAEEHETRGREALAAGQTVTAGEHLGTAAVCYHFAKFVFVNDLDQMREAHLRAVECRTLALPHLRPPGERVEIPYGHDTLMGILRRPDAIGRPAVVVMCMGLDSTKEESGTNEDVFLSRGMATLAFDGPGQGEAEFEFPMRPDFEHPVAAVFDWVETRPDLDADRMGLWGVSLGGYYAPRAAAFEPRAKACVSLSGPYDLMAEWDAKLPHTKEVYRVRSHSASEDEVRERLRDMTLAGLGERIECPTYIVAGTADRLVPWQSSERLSREVKGPVVFNLVEGGNHVCNNRPYLYRPQSADWMAGQLGVEPVS